MYPKEIQDKVERLYFVEKLKMVKIAKELNVSNSYVKHIIHSKKQGKSIDRKNYDSSSRFTFKDQDIINIKNYIKDESKCKNSLVTIANDLGLPAASRSTLSRTLKRLGVKRLKDGKIDASDVNNNIELDELKSEIKNLKQDNQKLQSIIDKNKLNNSRNLIFLNKKINELENERNKLNNSILLDHFIKILESVKKKISV